jgi:hypothetical protein
MDVTTGYGNQNAKMVQLELDQDWIWNTWEYIEKHTINLIGNGVILGARWTRAFVLCKGVIWERQEVCVIITYQLYLQVVMIINYQIMGAVLGLAGIFWFFCTKHTKEARTIVWSRVAILFGLIGVGIYMKYPQIKDIVKSRISSIVYAKPINSSVKVNAGTSDISRSTADIKTSSVNVNMNSSMNVIVSSSVQSVDNATSNSVANHGYASHHGSVSSKSPSVSSGKASSYIQIASF